MVRSGLRFSLNDEGYMIYVDQRGPKECWTKAYQPLEPIKRRDFSETIKDIVGLSTNFYSVRVSVSFDEGENSKIVPLAEEETIRTVISSLEKLAGENKRLKQEIQKVVQLSKEIKKEFSE
jgi:bisphosphoglycerate-dependent phosphoglycerate mutase